MRIRRGQEMINLLLVTNLKDIKKQKLSSKYLFTTEDKNLRIKGSLILDKLSL